MQQQTTHKKIIRNQELSTVLVGISSSTQTTSQKHMLKSIIRNISKAQLTNTLNCYESSEHSPLTCIIDFPDSCIYVRNQERSCERAFFSVFVFRAIVKGGVLYEFGRKQTVLCPILLKTNISRFTKFISFFLGKRKLGQLRPFKMIMSSSSEK